MSIFVSYSHQEKDIIDPIIHKLKEKYGTEDVWYDQDSLTGVEWNEQIITEIKKRDIFLIFLSEKSYESVFCNQEIALAKYLKKIILPFRIDEINIDKLSYIKEIHIIDTPKQGEVIENLTKISTSIDQWKIHLYRRKLKKYLLTSLFIFVTLVILIWSLAQLHMRNIKITLASNLNTITMPQNLRFAEESYDSLILCSEGYYRNGYEKVTNIIDKDAENTYALYVRATCDYYEGLDIINRNFEPDWLSRTDEKFEGALTDYNNLLKLQVPDDSFLREKIYFVQGDIYKWRYGQANESDENKEKYLELALNYYEMIINRYPSPEKDNPILEFIATSYFRIGELNSLFEDKIIDTCKMFEGVTRTTRDENLRDQANEQRKKFNCSIIEQESNSK